MDIYNLTRGITEEPAYRWATILDRNVLSKVAKMRSMGIPNDPMREIHQRLLRCLKQLPVDYRSAVGGRKGGSPRKNIERHKGSRYFYLLDIKSAYPNVDGDVLARQLAYYWRWRYKGKRLVSPDQVAAEEVEYFRTFLDQFCLDPKNGGLVVGAVASPALFNFYAAVLIDRDLQDWCVAHQVIYSRYLDDLTFSSQKPMTDRRRRALRDIILAAGFKISHNKAHVYDISKGPIRINGIGLEQGGRIYIPREFAKSLRGKLHMAVQGEVVDPDVINGMMGVFICIRGRRPANPTALEREILYLYQKYRLMPKCPP